MLKMSSIFLLAKSWQKVSLNLVDSVGKHSQIIHLFVHTKRIGVEATNLIETEIDARQVLFRLKIHLLI